MTTTTLIDERIAELEALAVEEGIILPMPVEMILWHESQGCVVDLMTGEVLNRVEVTPTANAKAVAHLLAEVEGEVAI